MSHAETDAAAFLRLADRIGRNRVYSREPELRTLKEPIDQLQVRQPADTIGALNAEPLGAFWLAS